MSDIVVRRLQAEEVGDRVILAIDTALGTSVALGRGGEIVEASRDDARGHAEAIGTLIARVLDEAGVAAAQVDAVVAGMGPGPFTGLRIGIAAAHAFGVGRNLQVLPLVSHDAVALDALAVGATAGVRVVQDAKRRELFITEYSSVDWAGVPVRSRDSYLVARDEYEQATNDVVPERIPAANLVRIAARKLASSGEFEADQALYLRLPDVMQPSTPKRVTP